MNSKYNLVSELAVILMNYFKHEIDQQERNM